MARLRLEHPRWTLRFYDHIQRRRSRLRGHPMLHSKLMGSRHPDRLLPSWSGSLHRPCQRLARAGCVLVDVAAAAVAPGCPVAHLDCAGGVFSLPSQLRRMSRAQHLGTGTLLRRFPRAVQLRPFLVIRC